MSTSEHARVRHLLTRRTFLSGAVAGAATLLAACGGGSSTPTPGDGGGAATGTAPSSGGTTPTTAATGTSAASPATGGDAPGGSLIIGTLGEAQSINPFISNESEGNWRIKIMFGTLVRLDAKTGEPAPDLAVSWERDGLTYTFTLQENAKFSDGTDLTAEDVAFTMKGILAKETGSPRQSRLLSIEGAEAFNAGTADDVSGIKVIDAKTFSVTLAQPDTSFLLNMRYVSPVPKALLEGKDLSAASTEEFFQNPIGAGPFKFVSWNVGGDFVVERNPYYYQEGKPYLDKVTHRTITDAQSLVNALLAGDIDASIYPSPAGYERLKENPDLNLIVPPFTNPDGWMFNFQHPYLAKKEVRQAVAYALDMEQFAADSLYGLGAPGVSPLAPGNYAFDKDLKPWPYDLEKARELLQQAGPPPPGIRFAVNKGNVLREDFLTYTQAQLAEIGWEIEPVVGEYATLVESGLNKNFDVMESNMIESGATIDPGDLEAVYATNGSTNYSSYSNPELDELLAQAKQELDLDKQKELYKQIQAILTEDLPATYSWYRPFLHVAKKTFTGYEPSLDMGGILADLENWRIDE